MSINGNLNQMDNEKVNASISQSSPMEGVARPARVWVKGVQILLTLLALLLLAKVCWSLFAPLSVPEKAPVITPDRYSQTGNSADQIVSIKETNPFAISGADFIDIVQNDQPVSENVKETSLDLKLHGVRFDDGAGSAIIDIGGNGGQTVFTVGDTITQGVVLSELLAGEVIITRGGVKESLRLEGSQDNNRQDNTRQNGQDVRSTTPSIRSGVNSRNVVTANNAPRNVTREDNTPTATNINIRDMLRVRRRRTEQGQFALFLQPGKNRDAFAQAGLVANDMLVNVNGTPPPENLRALYDMINRLSDRGSISMIVERDGIPKQITINPSDYAQTSQSGDEG